MTARSFGAPPLTAEIGTDSSRSGWLVVSEPLSPTGSLAGRRWCGSVRGPRAVGRGRAHYIAIPKVGAAPAGVPRDTRPLVKRPAW